MLGAVSAQTAYNEELPEPGTTPGSMMFGLERAQESISLALTFNKEKKVQKRIRMAQERLAEARKLSEANDSVNSAKAVEMHSKAMERADQAVRKLPEQKRMNAGKALNTTRNSSITVLEGLKKKLPENAMKGIDTAIEAHKNKGIGKVPDMNRPDDQNDNTTGRNNSADRAPGIETGQSQQDRRNSMFRASGRVSTS